MKLKSFQVEICCAHSQSFPTFGQRVPAGPIGDPFVKEITAVPSLVHPAVSVRVGPCQLSAPTNPHVPQKYTHTEAKVTLAGHLDGCYFKYTHTFRNILSSAVAE